MKTGQLHASFMLRNFVAAIINVIFSPQWLNIPLIRQESADATGTLTRDPPHSSMIVTH